jgi:hypothetical protein
MPSSLTVARWYTQTRNSQFYNSFSQQTKEFSLPKPQQRYRGNCKDFIIFFSFNYFLLIHILFISSTSGIDYNSVTISNQITIIH